MDLALTGPQHGTVRRSARLSATFLSAAGAGTATLGLVLAGARRARHDRQRIERLVEQIEHQVLHDALTGFPNQLLFEERLASALGTPGHDAAVLFLDLDRFKRVNDCLGHPAGDALLQLVAERIAAEAGPVDTIARIGGDEFTLLVTGVHAGGEAVAVARRLIEGFRRPFALFGQELFVTPSIGIAVDPDGGTGAPALLTNAHTAMYRAKDAGRNGYEVYATDMKASAQRRLAMEGELHNALAAGQLRVHYQPQVDLTSGTVVAVEALTRWHHPALGVIGPDTFIPLAEETGLIVAIDDWVLRTACVQARHWADAGLPALRVAVNLSERAFHRAGFVEQVAEILGGARLDPERLELELTESTAVGQAADSSSVLGRLEALGIQLAVDDFGTGYSSLSRLRALPLHTLKIDRSFVQRIQADTDDEPLIEAMIAMAHALELTVVAEGVETVAQRDFLGRHGCDLAQGYLFGRPGPPPSVEHLMEPAATLV
jgi:diguanylate cyclase (GGDEF)-like protein